MSVFFCRDIMRLHRFTHFDMLHGMNPLVGAPETCLSGQASIRAKSCCVNAADYAFWGKGLNVNTSVQMPEEERKGCDLRDVYLLCRNIHI